MEFCTRLKELRKLNNYTQEELAKKLGVTPGAIGLYEQNRREPDNETVKQIAKIFEVSIDYLLGFDEKVTTVISSYGGSVNSITPLHPISVPILGGVACGEPIYAPAEANMYATLNSDIRVDFALTATGDSMIDAHIFDGDIVFIREQPQVELGEIAAVSINNEVTLKRVYYYPKENKMMLTPANPKYAPMSFVNEELNNIRIMGKAIAVQHML